MHLRDLLEPRDFALGLAPSDKWDAIRALFEHMVQSGRVSAQAAPTLHEQVLARERSMSTGMERGIAIPHAAVDGIARVLAAVGIVSRDGGVSFDSIDARPADIVVLLLIPRAQKLVHIRTLAEIARVLGSERVRAALLGARTGEEAWNAVVAAEAARSPAV